MKLLSLVLLCLLTSALGSDLESNLIKAERDLEELSSFLKNLSEHPPQKIKEASKVLQNLAYIANQDIQSATSKDWVSPSQERLETIKKWAQVIAPHNATLIDSIFITSRDERIKKFAYEARSLLDFTYPDSVFTEKLNTKIQSTDNTRQTFKASDLLYEHRSLSEEIKESLVSKGKVISKDKKVEWASSLAKYGMGEGFEVLAELLKEPVDHENFSSYFKRIGPALAAVSVNGNKSGEMTEPFLKICDDVIENIPEYKMNFVNLKNKVYSKPIRGIAKNGSGYLDVEVKSYPLDVKLTERSEKPLENAKKHDSSSSVNESNQVKQSPWLWVIGILLLAAIIHFLMKAKSKN